MNRLLTIVALLLAALNTSPAHAQTDPLMTKRAVDLREAPIETSRGVAALPAQTVLTRLPVRQGAWIQVKTATGATGWVHLFDVTTASAPSAGSNAATGALRGLSNFFNRGSAQSTNNSAATATIGIRGLGAEDIANAQPNLAALNQLETWRQSATQARQFAAAAPWQARAVDPLPAPVAPAPATPARQEY